MSLYIVLLIKLGIGSEHLRVHVVSAKRDRNLFMMLPLEPWL